MSEKVRILFILDLWWLKNCFVHYENIIWYLYNFKKKNYLQCISANVWLLPSSQTLKEIERFYCTINGPLNLFIAELTWHNLQWNWSVILPVYFYRKVIEVWILAEWRLKFTLCLVSRRGPQRWLEGWKMINDARLKELGLFSLKKRKLTGM